MDNTGAFDRQATGDERLGSPEIICGSGVSRVIRIGVRQGWPDYDELAAENWPCAEKSDEVMSIL